MGRDQIQEKSFAENLDHLFGELNPSSVYQEF